MKLNIVAILLTGVLVSCDRAAMPEQIEGRFESNKEATIAKWTSEQPWGDNTSQMISDFGKFLGDGYIETKGNVCGVFRAEETFELELELVSSNDSEAIVRTIFPLSGVEYESTLVWDDSGYWVHSDDPIKNYSERFDRLDASLERKRRAEQAVGLKGLQP